MLAAVGEVLTGVALLIVPSQGTARPGKVGSARLRQRPARRKSGFFFIAIALPYACAPRRTEAGIVKPNGRSK